MQRIDFCMDQTLTATIEITPALKPNPRQTKYRDSCTVPMPMMTLPRTSLRFEEQRDRSMRTDSHSETSKVL